jgi:hypothetical protein
VQTIEDLIEWLKPWKIKNATARPPMQTQVDLGLCCAVFCATPSNVGYLLPILVKGLMLMCVTKKCNFSKGQFDQSVHIGPKVCPFWLKVWGMKNRCYIWPVHLIKVTFLTLKWPWLVKMDKCP